jgi:hypothetical protein
LIVAVYVLFTSIAIFGGASYALRAIGCVVCAQASEVTESTNATIKDRIMRSS